MQLENFKGFRRTQFPLGSFTLLLGANGTGKSNLFDALRFLRAMGQGLSIRDAIEGHTPSGPYAAATPGIRGGAQHITHLNSESPVFGVEVELGTANGRIFYSVAVDSSSSKVVHERLWSTTHPGQYVFSTDPRGDPLRQRPESPAIYARYHRQGSGRNPRGEFSSSHSILSQFQGRSALSRANESIAWAVRQELAAIRPLELRPEVLRQYAPLGGTDLGEHGENFAAAVWELLDIAQEETDDAIKDDAYLTDLKSQGLLARDRLAAITAWLNELTPHSVQDLLVQYAPTAEVIFAVKEGQFEEPLTARSLSDGTLRFAALAVALLGSTERQVALIEELENGVNPTRLGLLVAMLEQASTGPPFNQVLASTHSPAVLEYATEETLATALVMGWNQADASSHVLPLRELSKVEGAVKELGLGELQQEGWLQFAADRV